MASIFKRTKYKKRKDTPWMIAYTDENGHRKVVRGSPDKAVTREIAQAREDKVLKFKNGVITRADDRYVEQGDRPIEEHFAEYMDHCRHVGMSKGTLGLKETHIESMILATEAKRLSDLEPIAVEQFLQGLKTDGKSARTVNHYRADIVALMNWATKTGRIRNHSLSIIPKLNEQEDRRRVRRALTDEELTRLLEMAIKQDEANRNYFPRYPVYLTAVMTGLRRNELKHLIWADVDFENQTLRVRMNVAKAKREDIIPLHNQVIDALARIKPDNGRASGRVFNTMPTILTFYKDIVRAREKWINEATTDQEKESRQESDFLAKKDSEGRVVDLHALRTTLGTNLALKGVAPQIAQRIMRHSDYRTTLAHYTALRTADTVEAINSLPGVGQINS